MSKKGIILSVIAVVLVSFAALRFAGARRGETSEIGRTYTYQCGACNAVFEMDESTLRKHERAGRVETPPDGFKKYPCEKCGEIAAWYYERPINE